MALVSGMHHVCLRVHGEETLEKVIAYYTEILEMPLKYRWGSGESAACMIDAGNAIIEVFANAEEGRADGMIDHLALEVDDVDACVEAVRAKGYEVTIEPKDLVLPAEPPMDLYVAFVRGAAGESVEFFHVK